MICFYFSTTYLCLTVYSTPSIYNSTPFTYNSTPFTYNSTPFTYNSTPFTYNSPSFISIYNSILSFTPQPSLLSPTYFYCRITSFLLMAAPLALLSPLSSTSFFFPQYFISPLLSNSLRQSQTVIKHLTDFSLVLLTLGDTLANPTFFHTALSLFKIHLLIIEPMSLVLLGSIHKLTSSCERRTGILWWMGLSQEVESLVRIIISFYGVQRAATRKWELSVGCRLKGSFFAFHQQYPYMITTHRLAIKFRKVRLFSSSSMRPLITRLCLLW